MWAISVKMEHDDEGELEARVGVEMGLLLDHSSRKWWQLVLVFDDRLG